MAVWSGLGISAGQPDGTWTEFNNLADRDAIIASFAAKVCQIPRLRIISQYSSSASRTAAHYWALGVKAYKPTEYINYGLAQGGSVYLPTFYPTYSTVMLEEAQWAQDNGMDQFQIANEFEISFQRGTLSITSISRSSNVATATTATAHGLTTGDTIIVSGASDSSYNVSQVACTVTGDTTFTYASTGSDGSAVGTLLLKCGDATLIRFIKILAAQAQAVFTRGPITYSVSQGYETYWTSITPGTDLDLIGLDVYGDTGYTSFVSLVSTMFGVFGTKMIVTEFNLHSNWGNSRVGAFGPTNRGFDQLYADEILRRMSFLRTLGIQQAYMFTAWNASASENNSFSLFYNTNPTTGSRLQGNWKSGFDRIQEKRISHVFFGTQQHT